MITNNNSFPYKIALVNVFFLLLFLSIIININPNFPVYNIVPIRIVTHLIISGVAIFYCYTLVVFPLLEQEGNTKKFNTYIITSILAYSIFLFFFWFLNQKNLDRTIFSAKNHPLGSIGLYLFLIIIPLLITSFFSSLYSILFLGKKTLFKFLEILINIIIASLLYVIASKLDRGISIFLLTIVLIVFYINTFYITPILIIKKNKKRFWLSLLLLSAAYFTIMLSFFFSTYHDYLNLQKVLGVILNFFSVLCLIYLMSFIYGYFRLKIKNKGKILALQLENKESELGLLKSQVNPHFLFNTLNTLYSTALEENATKTAESTAKLASLIRYMQEDINKDFIPLENEIKYLQDYINIQKLRCSIVPDVETKFNAFEKHKISPGLFIPFVENAFKYGIDPSKKSKLFVSVICDTTSINFECINSYDVNFKSYNKEEGFGIGIKNAKQRLSLVYPKKHSIEIKKESAIFSVKIKIDKI